jgi:uncharacterized repeat protein (TIGR03837 family)
MRRNWDIFCSVVDNFGDIGVCWRLARRLSAGLGQQVRLWVDDLVSFKRLAGEVDPSLAVQHIDGIEVRHWIDPFPDVVPAQIVVEGFGVRLPENFVGVMAEMRPAPVWINLEYLSAESWVDEHHGLPSPHPRLPLTKHFFFPGFSSDTGGVLIEDKLFAARDAQQKDPAGARRLRRELGIAGGDEARTWISLFCYDAPSLPSLVEAWAADSRGIGCIVAEGYAQAQIAAIAGRKMSPGLPVEIGNLALHAIPFLPHEQYDRLLWSCDLNFVRGEDSFVRAQLAAHPLIWQAYPQEDEAHLVKTAAFRERYVETLSAADAGAYAAVFDAWNRQDRECGSAWPEFAHRLPVYQANAGRWAAKLAENGDLAANLARFCEDRLE